MSSYRIPFNRPSVAGTERACLSDAMAGGQLAGNGPFTRRCQSRLEELTTARKALLTSSCTHALEMSALLLDARPGDEVIVPSFAFVSTANAFAMRGLKPVFADCRPDTLNLDAAVLPRLVTPRTRAVVALHYGGVACDMDEILEFSRAHGLTAIEDNAHGLFGRYKGRPLGSLGTVATQSFHETKNVTCGEGGALLVNDPALIERAEVVSDKGTNRGRFFRGEVDKYTWIDLGSSFRLSELHAAFLWGQLLRCDEIQATRQAIWARYDAGLRDWASANDVRLPTIPLHCEHPAHLFYIVMPSEQARRRLLEHLKGRGILAVFHYVPLHLSPMGRTFGAEPGDCPVTEHVSERLLRLPFFADLSLDDQHEIIETLQDYEV